MCPERTVLRWRATTDDVEHYVYTKPYDGLREFARNQTVERFLKLALQKEGLSGDVGLRQRYADGRGVEIWPPRRDSSVQSGEVWIVRYELSMGNHRTILAEQGRFLSKRKISAR